MPRRSRRVSSLIAVGVAAGALKASLPIRIVVQAMLMTSRAANPNIRMRRNSQRLSGNGSCGSSLTFFGVCLISLATEEPYGQH